MGMWFLFLAFMFIGGTAAIIYLVTRFHGFSFIKGIRNRFLSWLAAAIPVLLVLSIIFYDMYSMIVVALHMALFFILSDIASAIYRKKTGKERGKRYWAGVVALCLTAVAMAWAFFNAYHVSRTYYEFNTVKKCGNIRVALVADSHLGVTLDGKRFGEQMERIDGEGADLLIIDGDFVDDSSSNDDTYIACQALGKMKTPVYFVYGNHDRGYYRNKEFDDFLRKCLTDNGVTILQDKAELIDGRFYLVGCEDRSGGPMEASDLICPLDKSKYIITCDHQPYRFEDLSNNGSDLVLAGHTHGGHVWPSGYFPYWFGINDGIWGLYKHGDTNCIVTSGISGWAIPFKTGTHSEYVIIDIHGE